MPSSAQYQTRKEAKLDPQVARLIAKVREHGNLSAAEIGQIVGVGTRQVQNWANGQGGPANNQRLRRLLDLEYLTDLLGEVFDDEGGLMWLHARNRQLDGQRPLDLVTQGETDKVIALLDRLADGNF